MPRFTQLPAGQMSIDRPTERLLACRKNRSWFIECSTVIIRTSGPSVRDWNWAECGKASASSQTFTRRAKSQYEVLCNNNVLKCSDI